VSLADVVAVARQHANLAFFVQGLLDLYEATSTLRWLEPAASLQRVLDEHYWDAAAGGYIMTSHDHEALLVRLLEGKQALRNRATAFICERGRCELPTSDPDVFARPIAKVSPPLGGQERAPLSLPQPNEEPEPREYDPRTDRHWSPGHGHWHQGRPPK
jgi:uncharacterized protein YyaL (SSP411 family)